MLQGRRTTGDRGLADQEAHPSIGFQDAEKLHTVPKEFVVEMPTLQVSDGRSLGVLIVTVDNPQAEKIGPSGLEVAVGTVEEPDLMLVSFLVGWSAQFRGGGAQVEVFFPREGSENSEFFLVMGRTSLKTRNCFTAAS